MLSVPQKFTWIYSGQKPTKLKADPFLGRKILQHAPDWILREAERWEHPWRFLLGVRKLPRACYRYTKVLDNRKRAIRGKW